MHSYCPQCGVQDTCDEDRCCPMCGADMVLEEVLALIRAEERERIAGEWDARAIEAKRLALAMSSSGCTRNALDLIKAANESTEIAASIRKGVK